MKFLKVRAKYIALTLLLVWVLSMMYMTLTMNSTTSGDSESMSIKADLLEKAIREVEKLRREKENLREHIESIRTRSTQGKSNKIMDMKLKEAIGKLKFLKAIEPSQKFEILRRRVETDVVETSYYIQSQLALLKSELVTLHGTSKEVKRINEIMDDMFEYYSVTANDLYSLSQVDGMEEWRKKETQDLANIVRNVIDKLQSPKNCSTNRLLICNLSKGCGFGCQVHHVVYCFIVAIGTNRTFVLNSKHWRYLDDGWNKFFAPPSRTCNDKHANNAIFWNPQHDSARVIQLPIIDTISPPPSFLPLAVPKQLGERLTRVHGDPFVWWVGQLLSYLMRPQPQLVQEIEENREKLGFNSGENVVGVHIRRTDKVAAEAAFHPLKEYMTHVDRYFDIIDLRSDIPVKRSIYLASDDPGVFAEVAQDYPQYTVIGNKGFSETASLNSRYSEASLKAVILDVHFLSECHYLVCTFSSQVCRLAYELMQTMHGDASHRFTSLDDIYYFGGQQGHSQIARLPHHLRDQNQIALSKGTVVKVAGNHWDGYSLGNLESNPLSKGLYPSFKVIEKVSTADFPVFDDFVLSSPSKVIASRGRVVGDLGKDGEMVFRETNKNFIPPGTGHLKSSKVARLKVKVDKEKEEGVDNNIFNINNKNNIKDDLGKPLIV